MTETNARSGGDGDPTTYVLIPGAGADPRVYEATIAALRDLGHDGIAPPLPLDDPDACPSEHAAAVIAALTERFGSPSEWGEEALTEVFHHEVDEATLQAAAEYEGRPAPGMFAEPFAVERWPYRPTTVLAPREDRLFQPEFQRRLTRERLGERVEFAEMDGGRLPMLSRPRDLAARPVGLY